MTSMIMLGPKPRPLGVLDGRNRSLGRRRLMHTFRSEPQAQQEPRRQRAESMGCQFLSRRQRGLFPSSLEVQLSCS